MSKLISSVFSNLIVNVGHGLASDGVNAALYYSNYKKRDGQLKFVSPRGYDNVLVYVAKRTMMQMTFATMNDLYPKLVRDRNHEDATKAYEQNQKRALTTIISKNKNISSQDLSRRGITLKYRGANADEGLLMWIKPERKTITDLKTTTYWDKIKGLSHEYNDDLSSALGTSNKQAYEDTIIKIPGKNGFLDLGATISASSGNNLILTKVQGRDMSRKEMISRGDINFTVKGSIVSNYPDIYPYQEVNQFISLMRHKGVIQVFSLMFNQFNVTQILIKDFQLTQNPGFKNVQPYSFSCVAVEPDFEKKEVTDTIDAVNLKIEKMPDRKWTKILLEQLKSTAADKASQMLQTLTSEAI